MIALLSLFKGWCVYMLGKYCNISKRTIYVTICKTRVLSARISYVTVREIYTALLLSAYSIFCRWLPASLLGRTTLPSLHLSVMSAKRSLTWSQVSCSGELVPQWIQIETAFITFNPAPKKGPTRASMRVMDSIWILKWLQTCLDAKLPQRFPVLQDLESCNPLCGVTRLTTCAKNMAQQERSI